MSLDILCPMPENRRNADDMGMPSVEAPPAQQPLQESFTTAHDEINAIEKTLLAIQSFPLDARRRVLSFAWAWAHDAKTLPN